MPVVSVLMSVYKEPLSWVKQSIDSILTQSFSDFEFIIINDNPGRSELAEFLLFEAEKDPRLKIHANLENIGLTKSLNVGLKLCAGKYIARMDADDISMPTRFEKQVAFMDSHPEVIVCGTKIKLFGQKNPLYCDTNFKHDIQIRGQLLLNSGFAHPSVFIRNEILQAKGIKYNESFRTGQDYKLWYDLRSYGKFANLPEKLLLYRISSNQVSKVIYNNQKGVRLKLSEAFRKDWLDKFSLSCNFEHCLEKKLKKLVVTHEDKLMYSYFLRSQQYRDHSLNRVLKIILDENLAISIKERMILILLSIKNKIQNLFR